jgi:hypothetical protein
MITIEKPVDIKQDKEMLDNNDSNSNSLYTLKTSDDKYSCCYLSKEGKHTLVVFSSQAYALRFTEFNFLDLRLEPTKVTLDEAVEIAKTRPAKIQAIALMDNVDKPEILIDL